MLKCQNVAWIYPDILCSHTKFHEKKYFCGMFKEEINVFKYIMDSHMGVGNCLFHSSKRYCFPETLCANIEVQIYTRKPFQGILTLKIRF
jgi:hypothetical protein